MLAARHPRASLRRCSAPPPRSSRFSATESKLFQLAIAIRANFKMHTDSITKYRQNLFKIAPEKKQLLTFFIKDDTALGNYVVINGKTETLNPMKLPLVLKILADTKGLDYVIFRIKEFYVPYLIIQPLSISILRNLLSNCYDSNAKYLQYQFMQDYHFWQTR